jgi:hypothetical protein
MSLAPMADPELMNRQAMLSQMAGGSAIAPDPTDSAQPPPRDLGENSPEAIAKLNAEHPEYSGGQPLTPATPAAPDYTKLGKYSGQMGAWSEADPTKPGNEKFARPWDDRSERYQMMSVLSNFDPTKGITPEVLDALNKANIHGAKFSGQGDKLTVDNAGNWARFGKGGTGDIITGLKSGHGTWAPWSDPNLEEAQGAQGGGGPMSPPLQNGMIPGQGGDMSNTDLTTSLNRGVPTDNTFFQQLLKQIQEQSGTGGMDRQALLSQMGGANG